MENLTLRQIRRAREISQQAMAEALNIERDTYIRWENQPSKISIEKCYIICELLGVEYNKAIFMP